MNQNKIRPGINRATERFRPKTSHYNCQHWFKGANKATVKIYLIWIPILCRGLGSSENISWFQQEH